VTLKFGWLLRPLRISSTRWSIEPLPDHQSRIDVVTRSVDSDGEWYWPPRDDARPARPRNWFALPETHLLTVSGCDPAEGERLAEFIVSALGFVFAQELLPEGWGHLTRVRINSESPQDFDPNDDALVRILDRAVTWWLTAPNLRDRFFGVFRWHAASFAGQHDHEIFAGQYMVLDACWRIHEELGRAGTKKIPHAARISALATAYALKPPDNWQLNSGSSPFVTIRNELFHEAKWGGKPIGFGFPASPNHAPHLELYWFNARLILALLGETSDYIRSPIVWQTYSLE